MIIIFFSNFTLILADFGHFCPKIKKSKNRNNSAQNYKLLMIDHKKPAKNPFKI